MTDFAKLVLDADTRGLKRGRQELSKTGDEAAITAARVQRSSGGIAKSFVKIGAAVGSAFAVSGALREIISTNAQFGSSMQRVAAISGATGEQLNQLRQTALDMGNATQFSASQAADALGFLAMAGFEASEAIAAIPSVLDLAAASGMELAQAADIASNVISGFGKSAGDAAEVADVLADAASSTNTNVGQLGQAMSTAAPIAAALGVSMQETAAAIGVMSDAGIQGERAGTALRGVFASLAGPTTQAQQALAKYGLTAADVSPEAVGLTKAMQTLNDAGLSTADAMIVFGREAASGALVMADASERMEELTTQFENADGAASDMAETMRDNLSGDIDQLNSAVEGMVLSLGDSGATGTLRALAQVGTAALRSLAENMNTVVTAVGAVTVAFVTYRGTLLATSAITTVMTSRLALQTAAAFASARSMGTLAAAKFTLTTATTAASLSVRALTAALIANPFTAVAVAVGTLASAMFVLSQRQKQARAETDNLIRSLRGLAQARSADFALRRAEAQNELNSLRDERSRLELERDRLRARTLSSPTGFQTRSAALQELNGRLAQTGLQIVGVQNELNLADKAFDEAGKAAESMVAPVAQSAGAVDGLSGSLKGAGKAAREARNEFADLMENLFPENTTRRQMQQLAQVEKFADRISDVAEARRRVLGSGDAPISESLLNTDPLREAGMVLDAAEKMGDGMADAARKAKRQTVDIAESFATMAQNAIQSLQGLISSIKGGGFLDILGSVLGLMGSLGVGGSGSKAAGLVGSIGGLLGFDGGGYTGNAPRSGGLDGKGGFLAMMHPQETVIDHSKGGKAGGMTVNVDARGSNDPEAVRQQVEAGIREAAPYIMAASEARTVRTLQRPRLAGMAR